MSAKNAFRSALKVALPKTTGLLNLHTKKWVQQGLCLSHHPENGRPIFVHGALPKEHVQVQIQKSRSTHAFAITTEVKKPSPTRISSDCQAFPECGGCSFRHISYQDELLIKQELLLEFRYIKECMEQAGFQMRSAEPDSYRNHVQIHATGQGKNRRTGFFALHSNQIAPLPDLGCRHISKELNHFIKQTLTDFPELAGRLAFRQTGEKCYFVPESATHSQGFPNKKAFTKKPPNLPVAPKFLHEEICLSDGSRLEWEFPSRAFWQANRFLLPVWLEEIQKITQSVFQAKAPQKNTGLHVLELFCGSGLIGGALALKGLLSSYVGIESSNLAIEAARRNFRKHNWPATFTKKDIYKCIQSEERLGALVPEANFLIANPPRAGLPKKISAWLRNSKIKSILYSSCNPATLNRDLKGLLEQDFRARKIFAFDFFPRTWHLEILIFLERKGICA